MCNSTNCSLIVRKGEQIVTHVSSCYGAVCMCVCGVCEGKCFNTYVSVSSTLADTTSADASTRALQHVVQP